MESARTELHGSNFTHTVALRTGSRPQSRWEYHSDRQAARWRASSFGVGRVLEKMTVTGWLRRGAAAFGRRRPPSSALGSMETITRGDVTGGAPRPPVLVHRSGPYYVTAKRSRTGIIRSDYNYALHLIIVVFRFEITKSYIIHRLYCFIT